MPSYNDKASGTDIFVGMFFLIFLGVISFLVTNKIVGTTEINKNDYSRIKELYKTEQPEIKKTIEEALDDSFINYDEYSDIIRLDKGKMQEKEREQLKKEILGE